MILATTSTTTTTTPKPKRRRRDSVYNDFEWSAKALVESGSIKPENIAFEGMTDPTFTTTTAIPLEDANVPYFGVCTNESKVILDPKKIYGYYQRTIIVENPVKNVSISNNVWLRHGDLCYLTIKYAGTAPFKYCTKIMNAENSTEALKDEKECLYWKETDLREFPYKHWFDKSSNSYSLIVFIKNEVAEIRTTIGVQFYEGE